MTLADLIVELGGPRHVAGVTGLSFKHVDNLAQGRRRPTADTLKRLAIHFPDRHGIILSLAEAHLEVPPSFWQALAGGAR